MRLLDPIEGPPLPDEPPDWQSLLRDPPLGAHVILWSDASPACDLAMETFVRGGLERDDLCAVVLPEKDLARIREPFRAQGLDLDRLEGEGRLLATTPEHLGLREPADVERVPVVLEDLKELTRACRRAAPTILGRIAPPFFERGSQHAAEAIERELREHVRDARMLCAYMAGAVTPDRLPEAMSLVRYHTHAITAVGEARFLVEPVHHSTDA